ncbi:hypothetical protein [Streptomyces sasae]|uniref:hypothetical protein n=1 Tax=Streptomyces sasae TaxID=1266772 RepID=UPI0029303E2E|nr:hypothetical protein [Streptomyces sasae]
MPYGVPPHEPPFQSRQLRAVLQAGKLQQTLVLGGVHLLLRWEELRVQRPAVPGRLPALAQRLQHRQRDTANPLG